MKTIIEPMAQLNEVSELRQNIVRGELPAVMDGCIDASKSHLAYTLAEGYPNRLVVTYNDVRARELYESFRFFDREVYNYPAKDLIFYSADVHGNQIVHERLRAVRRLLDKTSVTIVTTVDALMDFVMPLEFLREKVWTINVGAIVSQDVLS